ncbi:MAG: hypothetical protein WDW36_000480 [Sanguina aurantia]
MEEFVAHTMSAPMLRGDTRRQPAGITRVSERPLLRDERGRLLHRPSLAWSGGRWAERVIKQGNGCRAPQRSMSERPGLNSGHHATTGASLANFNLVGGAQGGSDQDLTHTGTGHTNGFQSSHADLNPRGLVRVGSGTMTSYNMAARTMAKFGGGGMSPAASYTTMGNADPAGSASCNSIQSHFANQHHNRAAMPSKMESIASSAVRAADKVGASLIVVYTHTGKTAQLVAKYRPPMPILTLVVPQLVSDSLHWKLLGRSNARQCLLTRGLMPMLAAPSPSGDALLEEAVAVAGRMGLVKPHDHVVCVQRIHDDFCVKIVAVDEMGEGIKRTPMATNTTSLGGPFGIHPADPPPESTKPSLSSIPSGALHPMLDGLVI